MTRFILMCAGEAKRWTSDTPKHLIEIDGEPLLKRTVRLIGDEDIYITSKDPRYNFAPRYEPQNNNYEIDRFLSNREIWLDNTVFIYGDTFYTPEAIEKIKQTKTDSVSFFGRRKGNKVKRYGEIFAVKVANTSLFEKACLVIREKEKIGLVRGLAWDVFRLLGKKNFVELDGKCEDFDKVSDFLTWQNVHQ